MPRPRLCLTLTLLIAVACGCGAIQEATGGAQEITQGLLTLINQGDYAGIREMMTGTLQDRFPPSQVESVFGLVHEEAGVCGSPRILNFRSNVNTTGSRLTLGFAADCTRGPIQGSLLYKTEEGVRKLESFSILRLIASSETVQSSEALDDVAVAK